MKEKKECNIACTKGEYFNTEMARHMFNRKRSAWMFVVYLNAFLLYCASWNLTQNEYFSQREVRIKFTVTCIVLQRTSSSIGTTAHCGLWPVEQSPSIFSYLPPTLSIFSLPALEDLFLLSLSILSWVFPFFLSLPVLEWRSFWASYPPPFSLGDLTS